MMADQFLWSRLSELPVRLAWADGWRGDGTALKLRTLLRHQDGNASGKPRLHIRIDLLDAETGASAGYFNGYGTGMRLRFTRARSRVTIRRTRDDLQENTRVFQQLLWEAMESAAIPVMERVPPPAASASPITPTVATASAPEVPPVSGVVYHRHWGTSYHASRDCRRIGSTSVRAMHLDDAQRRGLRPCRTCIAPN